MTSETMIKSAMNKVCKNIEQKGVAQLLQIEEVRLKFSRRCGFIQSPHAQEASILIVFYTRGGSVPGHGRVFARASTLVHN